MVLVTAQLCTERLARSRKTVSVIDLQVMGKASIINCVITLEGLAALLAFEVSPDVSIGGLTEDRLSPNSYRLL